ncbi:redoxin domain-containing protein [Solirubrobacter soli]|uniref:redoxin domain-containing protein n=1 Tax=Solirubrobacter soli TaxID=363832 RepID=UPI000428383C|nr:redoxin domain-containing protein [Solirubrobacter soli]
MATSPRWALAEAPVWINGEPDLRGRIVLVDFWTYTCVNWLRTLPYVRAWHERYEGLTVVGAHSPEFSFEHELDHVRRAVATLDVPYPVAIDNDFTIWRAFGNHYWPATYLVDGDGNVRFEHFGEGNYDGIERAIQALLGVDGDLVEVDADGVTKAADWANVGTPETYVGTARGDTALDLRGAWTVGDESALLESGSGTLAFDFQARDLNLVMSGTGRFTVHLDGEPPGDDHGVDVTADGEGSFDEPRMYQLIRQRGDIVARTFEIAFDDPGARAYVFTFG